MKTSSRLTCLFSAVSLASLVLTACGGGGSSAAPAPAGTPVAAPAPNPAPAPSPAPAPAPVATTPAGTSPSVTSASCAGFQSASVAVPTISGNDMQLVSDVLGAVDPGHGGAEFVRLPSTFMWWVRSSGAVVNMDAIGVAIHESNHTADLNLLSQVCNTDGLARYYADSKIYVTGLRNSSTANYSIVSETYPASLKAPRSLRYDLYITGSASSNGNQFNVLLDELNAYSGAANFEAKLLASNYSYLSSGGDKNVGGMVDFMLFLQSYLKAARLNHPASYTSIQSSGQTLAFVQFEWSRAERILSTMYPYSVAGGGTQVVPVDALTQIYSAPFLDELDSLGITHKSASDFSTTYLR